MSRPKATEDDTLEAEVDTETTDTEAATKPAKPDGRKRRWRDHKIARREELVDGTLAAIRLRGREIGMDEIASEIGISKTVLYRYFTDKNDLTNATMTRYVETTLAPRIYTAISEELDEYQLTRAVIAAYVETVATDPEVYLYVMANNAGTNRDVVAESERMIAELLATVLGERLRTREMDSGGSVPWAFAIVGAVQLATHWWISNKSMSAEDLIDYLCMMTWGGIHGVAQADGSPAKFKSQPHPLVDEDRP
ncbi:TetR/AcrR family transcriptional regulator [Rhodococcus sp. H29-C3]|uniref:TetR/AcrR family transcriptional regulator n=1 Tax=Rhodococcus sp. H29-C3 TaxID=3046307 RepID=UPI0024BA2AF7|nr:TetR/AcrR family transcriptional regulator [Rhodococcus sp. H29-C3]MDJ0358993.1 TetR/AcrR family transcriptional regulator [Rhodococcus sp. H29-C3]